MSRLIQACWLAWLSWACAGQAYAHGGLWRVNGVHAAAQGSGRMVLQSSTRGIVIREAEGKSWQWVCSETFGRASTAVADVDMALSNDGRLWIAALSRGLLVSTSSPCRFESPEGLGDLAVRDVVRGRDRMLALTLASDASSGGSVYSAAEASSSFKALGTPLPQGFSPSSLRETEQGALLVAGSLANALMLQRSDDQGAHWQPGATMTVSSQLGWDARIMDVARDGKVVFVLQNELEWGDADTSHDTLYVSDDGGLSLRPLFTDGTPIGGLALAPDGSSLLIASVGGLQRAALSDALAQGQASFKKLSSERFYGLHWSEQGLYAGRDEFGESADAFSLGVSRDQGQTFTRVMGLCDVVPMPCAEGSEGALRCPVAFDDQGLSGGGFKQDFLDTRCTESMDGGIADSGAAPVPSDAGSEPVDAGTAIDAAQSSESPSSPAISSEPTVESPRRPSTCALQARAHDGASGWLSIALAAVWLGQRRMRCAQEVQRTGGRR